MIFFDLSTSAAPHAHLRVGICVAPFGRVFVPHGRHPAGLAPLGEGANIQDAQHAATHTQLILQDEAVLRAQRQAWPETSMEIERHHYLNKYTTNQMVAKKNIK